MAQPTLLVKDAGGINRTINTINPNGIATAANSQPVCLPSDGTLPLPTGAATAAKQPALGTAGTPSADVLSVQGVASGTAQPVSAASLPLPTGASTAAKQPALGTAGAASADVLSIQGIASMTAVAISAASLPLPSGAATAAKQPALGTAGAASADVLSIQGVASMTAVKTDPSAVTSPVSMLSSTAGSITSLSSTTNATALASNASRKGALFVWVAGDIYISLGSSAATASVGGYSFHLSTSNPYYEVPFGYTGQIQYIGANTPSAAVQEIT